MVSRQETSRPLLTPGEVMQLSPNEAIVMVSGLRPVRAQKVRYYEDPQFQNRILKPPRVAPTDKMARFDEWSAHAPISPSVELLANLKRKTRDQNGGHRREPELPQQRDLVVTAPLTEYDLGVAPDEGDADVVQATALNRSMQGLARAVSLDPDDRMGL
jgi:type IV secretion system protein VirD4